MELWFLFTAHHLIMLYSCTKFGENISQIFGVIEGTRFSIVKFAKGHNFVKNVDGF